uniref:Uncharacterized protein LOC111132174 n=1 Tax=Crassostrea virginica TaxID=6565 RepID=A0A8B8E655_CRAVI|nr:uncharacterized protein LOC111132174 [Crassostrea virginica]
MVLRLVLVTVLFIIEGASCGLCPGDPENYVTRGDRTCRKIYNCTAGHEIVTCSQNCRSEFCQPCRPSWVQPFLIHSTTAEHERSCFEPKGDCNNKDLIPVRNGSSSVGCRKAGYCQCNVYQCWFGHNPCNCERHFDGCSKNEYLEWNGNTARCVKCPQGFSTPTAGCGPCYKLPSIDAASEQTTASIFSGIHKTTTSVKTASSTYQGASSFQGADLIYPLVGVGIGIGFGIIVACIVCVICRRRGRCSNRGILRKRNEDDVESTEDHPLPVDVKNTDESSRSLLTQEQLSENATYEILSSVVASETEQPGTFHPNDPRILGPRYRPEGVSLEEDESPRELSSTVNEETSLLNNSSCLDPSKVDTMEKSEGISYIICKLTDADSEVKQPVQCEEDTLTSQTNQKLPHSDVTHRKEVADVYSLTDEKVLCAGNIMMESTSPKYYVN